MKKALLICLSMVTIPTMCFGQHPRIAELIKIKQQKMAELEKCTGTTKNLKIAGISTLGITAVGVAGNIAEASVIKKYDKQIDATDKDIAKAQKELDSKKEEIAKRQAEEAKKAAEATANNANSGGVAPETETTAVIDETGLAEIKPTEGFKEYCESLGGQYYNGVETFTGTTIAIQVVVHDGCIFQTEMGLDDNCELLKPKSSPSYHSYKDRSKRMCAFVDEAVAKCLNGEAECSDADPKTAQATRKDTMDCERDVLRSFINGIPSEFNSVYNALLKTINETVADKDGTVSEYVNGHIIHCKQGQKIQDCSGAATGVPELARHYTINYVKKQKCGSYVELVPSLDINSDPVILEDTDDVIKNQKKQHCLDVGAVDYDTARNICICPNDKEWDGSKCVAVDIEKRQKCTDSYGTWANGKCDCGGRYLVDDKCLDQDEENKIICEKIQNGEWVKEEGHAGWCKTETTNADLSMENACLQENGYMEGGICICPTQGEYFDLDTKTCKMSESIQIPTLTVAAGPVVSSEIKIKVPDAVVSEKSPEQRSCERWDGEWDGTNCKCPEDSPVWKNNKCVESDEELA